MDGAEDEELGWEGTGLRFILPQPSPRLQPALLTGAGWGAHHQQEGEQECLQVLHHGLLGFSGCLRGGAASGVSSCSQQGFIA